MYLLASNHCCKKLLVIDQKVKQRKNRSVRWVIICIGNLKSRSNYYHFKPITTSTYLYLRNGMIPNERMKQIPIVGQIYIDVMGFQ